MEKRRGTLEQRRRSRIHQIAVLDNGSGMNATVLRLALQFDNGTHLAEEKHTGIGRFGMGLPCSSISRELGTGEAFPGSSLTY